MKKQSAFEQILSNFNRTTGLQLTSEEANKALGVKKKKPFFMKKEEYEAEVAKRKDAMRIALSNIVIMRDELVDDERYYNDIVKKYNDLCERCDQPARYQKELISKGFEFTDLKGRNPFEWENFMKDRITYLVGEVCDLRKEIGYLRELEAGHT